MSYFKYKHMAAKYVSGTGTLGRIVKVHNNRILLYHSITSHLSSDIYNIDSSMFYNQMKILQTCGNEAF